MIATQAKTIAWLPIALVLMTGCDPEDVDRAKREATSKAVEVRQATTQKVEDVREKVEPYVDEAARRARQAYEAGKEKAGEIKAAATQKAEEIRERVGPYVDKAKAATTQVVESVKEATTQAVDRLRGEDD